MLGSKMTEANLIENGFVLVAPFLDPVELSIYESAVSDVNESSIASRNLLDLTWCQDLATKIRGKLNNMGLLPKNSVAVQCTYFAKSVEQNWLVPVHQDLSIPVAEKIQHPDLSGWTLKDGVNFVQPPDYVLDELVAVRIHLDDCGITDGPLRIVAGSHKFGRVPNSEALSLRGHIGETVCPVRKGGALLMKPLVLHASSKSSGNHHRRVLHFVFGPPVLPFGLTWNCWS